MNRALDVAIACILIVFTFPLMAIVALAIKLDSPGPILFSTDPLGHDRTNRTDIFKFRTSVYETDTLEQGTRLTRIGWYLYHTRIDDLPQLFNVLRGDLSLTDTQALPLWWRPRI
jgi:lipopolysaccharide/colanic/teichoic acid biosynthesis glycosyltransferase